MTENLIDPGTVVLTALVELAAIPLDTWTEGPVFDRAVRLDRARALKAVLDEGIRDIEMSLIESMEEDHLVVPGVGRLVRTRASTATWRDKDSGERLRADLTNAVAVEVALDVATGEVDPMKRNVALAALRVAMDAIPSFSSLKVAGRNRLGLNIEDYRSFSHYYVLQLQGADQ